MIDKYDPYIELASEIVSHNIKRYISAAKRLHEYRDTKALYEMHEIERWFYSDRFRLYCRIHPDRIMEYIKKELKQDGIIIKKEDSGTTKTD